MSSAIHKRDLGYAMADIQQLGHKVELSFPSRMRKCVVHLDGVKVGGFANEMPYKEAYLFLVGVRTGIAAAMDKRNCQVLAEAQNLAAAVEVAQRG